MRPSPPRDHDPGVTDSDRDVLGRLIAEAKLEAIRAFVERVEAQYEDTPFTYPGEVFELMRQELAAMEGK